MYYLTLNVQNRKCIFGKIKKEEMILNEWGFIAETEWIKSFNIRKGWEMDEFIIMPNHLHGIVIVNGNIDSDNLISNHGCASRFRRSISSFIAGYKSSVTSRVNDWIDHHFDCALDTTRSFTKYNRHHRLWQRNFHDHIVRNEKDYIRIKNYIRNNPSRWAR